MAKRSFISIVGIVIGIVGGMIFMMMLHMATTLVYPLPEGADFMSQDPENLERLNEWFSSLPTGAFVLAAVCHGLGCMFGAILAMFISGRTWLMPAIIVGLFFTVCGIMNLSSVPHPSWFPFVDVPIYLVLAIAAGLLLKKNDQQLGTGKQAG